MGGMLEAALSLASIGWAVFPCGHNKHPIEKDGGGCLSATRDPDQIITWWRKYPRALIGVATGEKSGFFAIDLDTPDGHRSKIKNEPGPDGLLAWDELTKDWRLPPTRRHVTASGGVHLLFRYDPARPVTNSGPGLPPGVDVRGDGGYIIAPPSRLDDGRGWAIAETCETDTPAEAPEALYALLQRRPKAAPEPAANGHDSHSAYVKAAVERELFLVSQAPIGRRNATLNTAAYNLGGLVGAGLLSRGEVERMLYGAAYGCGLVQDDSETTVRRTIESGMGAGMAQPRSVPERARSYERAERAYAPSHYDDGAPTAQEPPAEPPLATPELITAASFAGRDPPERLWYVRDLIPDRAVTMLSGDGDVGKSLLALQLAAAGALGKDWVGYMAEPGRTLYLAAEDEQDELHRRLVAIVAGRFELSEMRGLEILPFAGLPAVLAQTSRRQGVIEATPLWAWLVNIVEQRQPRLLILDNLADVFAGNEISRSEARQFISLLRGLAIKRNLAVVLLAHPSKDGLATGSGTSGSTAWNNSVRARLYLERRKDEDDGAEADPDRRVLRLMKSNYSRAGLEVGLRWSAGRFTLDGPAGGAGFAKAAEDAQADDVFLNILKQFNDQNRNVSANPGATFAPALFAKNPLAKGVSKRTLHDAMERLMAAKRIVVEERGPPSKRRPCLVVRPSNGEI